MKTLTRSLIIGTVTANLLTACGSGSGFKSEESQGSGSPSQSQTGGGQDLGQVDLKGYVDGGTYDKVRTVDIDKTAGDLILNVPMGLDPTIMIFSGSVPSLPGLTFTTFLSPEDGQTYLTLRVPVRYVLQGVSTLPANRLPNGDPLPMMPAGEYPTTAFSIPIKNSQDVRAVHLYLGVDAIGIYVESPWMSCTNLPICINMTFPIKNASANKILGYMTTVMAKGSFDGGMFLGMKIPNEVAAILEEYFL